MTFGLFVNGSVDTGRIEPYTSSPVAIRMPLRQVARAEPPPAAPQHPPTVARRRRRALGINFFDMIDHLRGKSGQGYYVEMAVGTPPQKVTPCMSSPSSH